MAKGDFIGEFELYVLLALAHLGDDAYGVTTRREIEARTDRTVAIGAVYANLARLGGKGPGGCRLPDPPPALARPAGPGPPGGPGPADLSPAARPASAWSGIRRRCWDE